MKRFSQHYILIFCLLLWGCGDTTHIQQLQLIRPDISELIKTEVVTDLPDEAWETIKYARYIFHEEEREELKQLQEAYYDRYIDADGIAIVGNSEEVSDAHFVIVKNIVLLMTSKYPELRDHLRGRYYNILFTNPRKAPEIFILKLPWAGTLAETVIPRGVFPDIPKDISGTYGWTASSVSESVGLRHVFSTFTHEFAHLFENMIVRYIDPDLFYLEGTDEGAVWKGKLQEAYENAEDKGLWPNHILRGAAGEFWAELTTIWFFRIGNNDYDLFETVEEFVAHDPLSAALIMKYYPNVSFSGLKDFLND